MNNNTNTTTTTVASCQPADVEPADCDTTRGSSVVLNASDDDTNNTIKLTKQRWLVLIALSVFGLALILNDTAAILNLLLDLLQINVNTYVYINQVFDYVSALSTLPCAWFVDRYGMKPTMYIASTLLLINGILRALLYYPNISHTLDQYKLTLYIVCNLVSSEVSKAYFLLPLKIAETWFPAAERSIAWTVMMSQMSIGLCITGLVYPRTMRTIQDLKWMAYISVVPAIISLLLTLAFITRSDPKYPPNERSVAIRNEPIQLNIWTAAKKVFKHSDLLIHLVHFAIYESSVILFMQVAQDIYLSTGHTAVFAGDTMAMSAIVSLVAQFALSGLVNRTKDARKACVLLSLSRFITFAMFVGSVIFLPEWAILTILFISTIFGAWLMPNIANMTSFLSSGTISHGTIIGFVMLLITFSSTVIKITFVKLIRSDRHRGKYFYSLIFLLSVGLINESIYAVFFKGRPTSKILEKAHTNSNVPSERVADQP